MDKTKPIKIRFLGITENEGALIEAVIPFKNGSTQMRVILTAENPELELSPDDLSGGETS